LPGPAGRGRLACGKLDAMTFEEWKAVILKVEPRGKAWIVDGLADQMELLATKFGIDTPLRQQHFLAQCAHESDHFQTTREYASGRAYEGRKDLGNTQKGDGERYRGRGLIQLTGRYNYEAASKALGEPYVDKPELVEVFPAAAIVSGWFWAKNDINKHADRDDIRAVTKVVNGGLNGLNSRQAALTGAKSAFA
jgi:putative chitinase